MGVGYCCAFLSAVSHTNSAIDNWRYEYAATGPKAPSASATASLTDQANPLLFKLQSNL
jgi:hypothetical protein